MSAHDHGALCALVEARGLKKYFDHVCGLDIQNCGTNKKAVGLTLHSRLLHENKLRSDELVMIGDSIHDHEVAQELQIDCVLVAHGVMSKERLEDTGVPVFDSFSHLAQAWGINDLPQP